MKSFRKYSNKYFDSRIRSIELQKSILKNINGKRDWMTRGCRIFNISNKQIDSAKFMRLNVREEEGGGGRVMTQRVKTWLLAAKKNGARKKPIEAIRGEGRRIGVGESGR